MEDTQLVTGHTEAEDTPLVIKAKKKSINIVHLSIVIGVFILGTAIAYPIISSSQKQRRAEIAYETLSQIRQAFENYYKNATLTNTVSISKSGDYLQDLVRVGALPMLPELNGIQSQNQLSWDVNTGAVTFEALAVGKNAKKLLDLAESLDRMIDDGKLESGEVRCLKTKSSTRLLVALGSTPILLNPKQNVSQPQRTKLFSQTFDAQGRDLSSPTPVIGGNEDVGSALPNQVLQPKSKQPTPQSPSQYGRDGGPASLQPRPMQPSMPLPLQPYR